MNPKLLIGAIIAGFLLFMKKASAGNYTPPPQALPYLQLSNFIESNYGLPHNLLVRMEQQESNFDPNAQGPGDEEGILQFVPSAHPDLENPYDPVQAIQYAGKWLAQLYRQFGCWYKVLAAYNWGPGNLKKAVDQYGTQWLYHAPAITQKYVADIARDLKL